MSDEGTVRDRAWNSALSGIRTDLEVDPYVVAHRFVVSIFDAGLTQMKRGRVSPGPCTCAHKCSLYAHKIDITETDNSSHKG